MAQKFTKTNYSATAPKPSILSADTKPAAAPVQFVFGKANYQLLAVSVFIVALGFVIMSGNTDIYSTTKIVIAPIVVLAGFGLAFYAIFKKPAA